MRFYGALAVLASLSATPAMSLDINFGNDSGEWANDNECDDPRFAGPGMTTTTLLSDDILADASDCRNAYKKGRLVLRGVTADGTIDFGDDSGEWANDRECDDMRFAGPGMTSTPLLFDDIMADATDCRRAFEAGRLTLAGQ